ncbi:ATP-binding protein [Lipingzhangella sp. LS1_29]|uniref:histidine kinase n=1 Tax=Lipingzhangella rawalii TaxID=2055835 RepID=A0ABU2H8S9_9ACTN|nr:ATP-binding protein [Lipingzhangella rawalii]MDS1271717.1 ATP-binding protein [Lipingzhangella rawalii]
MVDGESTPEEVTGGSNAHTTTGTAAPVDSADSAAPAQPPEAAEHSEATLSSAAMASLAMRDLTLVESLLDVLEGLENETEDPDLLAKLFKMDNLATRMRRNGENLLVLAGQGPEDPHLEPMPILDVARAAISEIGDYNRVQVGKLPDSHLAGPVGDDLAHLLAELLDNATAKSPEHAQVVVSGQPMADGKLLLAVEDEGIGVPAEQLGSLNERLAGSAEVDEGGMRHMGLYVVSRIAHRHGMQVQLEQRAFRGMSAFVVVPHHLLREPISSQPPPLAQGPAPAPAPAPASGGPRPGSSPSGATTTAAGLPRRSARQAATPVLDPDDDSPPATSTATPATEAGAGNRAQRISSDIDGFLAGERAAAQEEQ